MLCTDCVFYSIQLWYTGQELPTCKSTGCMICDPTVPPCNWHRYTPKKNYEIKNNK
jgi:hypothetical protein